MGVVALLGLVLVATSGMTADPDPQGIVGGSQVQMCGWPTTVYTGGCTATLVHPKAISTAQHCGAPSSIQFGESAGAGPTVAVLGCVGDGSQDAMLCELAEEVTGLPLTPVLFGCEADTYLQVGQAVVMAGFGQTSYGVGGGTKLWAEQSIAAVEDGRVIVGEAGDGTSPCPGDSGGPVFVQVSDGSWRVFGTVLGGTTATPCNSAADFQRIDAVVANFEAQTGVDITPCFDGASGDWDPSPECGGFFAGDHTGSGTWSDWCDGTPAGGFSDECGPAFGDGGDDESGASTGSDDGGVAETGGPATTNVDDGGDDGGGEDDGADDAGADDGNGGTGGGTAAGQPLPPSDGAGAGGCNIGPEAAWGILCVLPLLWRRRHP